MCDLEYPEYEKCLKKEPTGHREQGLYFNLDHILTVFIRHFVTNCGYPRECQTPNSENISK